MRDEVPAAGQRVHVYYNIPRDTLSVRNTKRKVMLHRSEVVLKDAEFRVSEPGRQRAIDENCRNIHAMVYGSWSEGCPVDCPVAVRYNPYEAGHFQTVEGGLPVDTAEWVLIKKNRCFVPEDAVS